MEVHFTEEVKALHLGAGETFHGEGILAITKALLQSGVAYVGGYQGAPVSHLLDVMVQARPYLNELGVHVEACSNEASAAAMLGASLHYPVRGAVTWKSIVGTNVAADALSNLASPGVRGGALIVSGEDYGEGASVIQERTHAFAMKSTMLLLDPRPELAKMVRMVEHGFAMSEASNMPAILQLRIRACHVRGSFTASDNVAPAISAQSELISWGEVVVNTAWHDELFEDVDAGGGHTVARRMDGSLISWGDNSHDQCQVPPLPPDLWDQVLVSLGQAEGRPWHRRPRCPTPADRWHRSLPGHRCRPLQ